MSKASAALAACMLLYVVLAGARARADRPMVDEAWLGSPALNLMRQGSMHTSILESKGTYYEGLDRYTFWILPGYPVVLAGWFGVVGFGLLTMRALSVLFGCVLLGAMYVVVVRLTKDQAAAALTALLLATDFVCVRAGAAGRMDLMCAALGVSGLAMYLTWRERNLRLAFVAGHALVAASVFTHPNGILYFGGLLLTATMWDRHRIRFSDLVLGALPYLVLLGAWGLYIAQDPALFARQLGGNASGRMGGLTAPFAALQRELLLKYLGGGEQPLLRMALLLPYAIGIAGALAIGELRRHKGVQTLLALTALFFVYNWLFEGVKLHLYLVHLSPLYVTSFAIVLRELWKYRRARLLVVGGAALLVAVQIAGTAYTIARNSYHTVYLPTVAAVRQHARPGQLVMGSAEFAFGLGFDSGLVDDVSLGAASGRRADIIVLDRRYKDAFAARQMHTAELLGEYSRVAAIGDCEVLVRR